MAESRQNKCFVNRFRFSIKCFLLQVNFILKQSLNRAKADDVLEYLSFEPSVVLIDTFNTIGVQLQAWRGLIGQNTSQLFLFSK